MAKNYGKIVRVIAMDLGLLDGKVATSQNRWCSVQQRYSKGRYPSGDKTSPPPLFAILVNNLVNDGKTRVKYVDDLSVLEIIPRCSTSMLPFVARDIIHLMSDPEGNS